MKLGTSRQPQLPREHQITQMRNQVRSPPNQYRSSFSLKNEFLLSLLLIILVATDTV